MRRMRHILPVLLMLVQIRMVAQTGNVSFHLSGFPGHGGNVKAEIRVKEPADSANYVFLLTLHPSAGAMPVLEKRWETNREGLGRGIIIRELNLAPGTYRVTLEWRETKSGTLGIFNRRFTCNPPGQRAWLSDPQLTTCPDEMPVVTSCTAGMHDRLEISAVLRSPQDRNYLIRVALFRKGTGGLGLTVGNFVSVSTDNQIVKTRNGGAAVASYFGLSDLPPGEYLAEIYLYEDRQMLSATSRSFRIEWAQRQQVMQNVSLAFQQMRYAGLNPAGISPETPDALVRWWEMRKTLDCPYEGYEMEQFFVQVLEAEAQYPEMNGPEPGDRGRARLQFGKPDRVRRVQSGQSELEIWYYNEWEMKIPFLKQGTSWKRIGSL